jgi:hypothetical protein
MSCVKNANPRPTPPDVVDAFLWASGSHGTFVIDGNDQIFNLHGRETPSEFAPIAADFTAIANARGFEWAEV